MFKYQFRWDTVCGQLRLPDVGAADDADHLGRSRWCWRWSLGLIIALMDMSRFPPLRWIGISLRRDHPQHADPGAAAVGLLRAADRVRRAHRIAHRAGHRPVALPGRLHLRGLPLGHPGRAAGPQRGGAGAGPDADPDLPPHRAAAGDPHDPAAARLQLRAAHQVLLARRGDLGERDHAARHGARAIDLPAARDLHLHRRRLLLDLLAARHGHPAGGNAGCRPAEP